MKSDIAIKQEGFNVLKEKLGLVNMERFVVLINREKFNYTEWRKDLFEDMDIHTLAEEAENFSTSIETPHNK